MEKYSKQVEVSGKYAVLTGTIEVIICHKTVLKKSEQGEELRVPVHIVYGSCRVAGIKVSSGDFELAEQATEKIEQVAILLRTEMLSAANRQPDDGSIGAKLKKMGFK